MRGDMSRFARATMFFTLLLAAGAAATVAVGAQATFAPSADLCMGTVAPYSQNNEGIEYWCPLGNYKLDYNNPSSSMDCRVILRFDVSALGGIPGLQVNSMSIKFTSTGLNNGICDTDWDGITPMHPEIHLIKPANRDWEEGTGVGYWFVPNETCCVAKQTGTTPGSVVKPWAGSAGLTTPGIDYDPTVLATKTINENQVDTLGEVFTLDFGGTPSQLTALVNAWLVDNYTLSRDNPGLLMFDPTTVNDGRRRLGFFSFQCTNPPWTNILPYPASYQPQLIVNYSQVPEPGALMLLASGLAALLACVGRSVLRTRRLERYNSLSHDGNAL
jgi:hypothetical protein